MPASIMDNPFAQAVQSAGFTIVENDVFIPNVSVPFLTLENGKMSIKEPLATDLLRPWEASPQLPRKISLIHFSLLDCAPCREEITWLHSFARNEKMAHSLQIFQTIYGTNVTQLVADEMSGLLPERAKTYLDLDDALAERLGVVGAPSTMIVDEAGLVVGYRNGATDFENPSFDIFVSRIKTWEKLSQNETFRQLSLHKAVALEKIELPIHPVRKFLENIPVIGILLVICALVCYSLFRSHLKRLKKFLGLPPE